MHYCKFSEVILNHYLLDMQLIEYSDLTLVLQLSIVVLLRFYKCFLLFLGDQCDAGERIRCGKNYGRDGGNVHGRVRHISGSTVDESEDMENTRQRTAVLFSNSLSNKVVTIVM